MTAPRYYRGVPGWVWPALAMLIVAALVYVATRQGIAVIRADERAKVYASAQHFDSVSHWLKERQLRRVIDSLTVEAARVDTVIRRRVDSVPVVIAAVPESVYLAHPEVERLGKAYEAMAQACDDCRTVNGVLRDSLAAAATASQAREARAFVLVSEARAARDAAERAASRRVSRWQCGTVAGTAAGLGYLLGRVE